MGLSPGSGARVRKFLTNGIMGSVLIPNEKRWRLLRLTGLSILPSQISSGVFFGGKDIAIGRGSGINMGVVLDNLAPITIGDRCFIGHQALLLTSSHAPGAGGKVMGPAAGKPIVIEDQVWIGARATIMPGVTVRRGCIVAAGALVTKDTAPGGIYAGVPAQRIGDVPVASQPLSTSEAAPVRRQGLPVPRSATYVNDSPQHVQDD